MFKLPRQTSSIYLLSDPTLQADDQAFSAGRNLRPFTSPRRGLWCITFSSFEHLMGAIRAALRGAAPCLLIYAIRWWQQDDFSLGEQEA